MSREILVREIKCKTGVICLIHLRPAPPGGKPYSLRVWAPLAARWEEFGATIAQAEGLEKLKEAAKTFGGKR